MGGCVRPVVVAPPLVPVTNLWVASLPSPILGPLATDGERLFVATREKGLLAFDPETGAQRWARPELSGVVSAASGALVVRSEDGTVAALDPATGATRWSVATGASGRLPASIAGSQVFVAGSSLAALDLATGGRAWTVPLPAAAATSPVPAADCVLVGVADGPLHCFATTDGRTRWTLPLEHPLEAEPAADGDRAIVGTADRMVLSVKLKDGKRAWRFKLGATVSQPAVILDRLALVASNEGVLYAFDRGNGHLVWRAPLPSRPLSAPIPVGSQVVLACHDNLIVGVDAAAGLKPAQASVGVPRLDPQAGPSELRTAPVLLGRTLFVGVRNPWALLALTPGMPEAFPQPPERPALETVPAP
jgi:outer membrane protein assembly factor BamB